MQAFYPQPRGRPRNNATWNTRIGRWVPTTQPMLSQQVKPVIARTANFIAEAQRKAAIEREAQERAEKFAAETEVAEAAAAAAAAERTRKLREQERLDATRRVVGMRCHSTHSAVRSTTSTCTDISVSCTTSRWRINHLRHANRRFPRRRGVAYAFAGLPKSTSHDLGLGDGRK